MAPVSRGDWAPTPEPLPVPVVDNHCHLDFPLAQTPERSIEDLLDEAASVGVDRVVQIGCDPESVQWTADAVTRYPRMLGGLAVHPNDAARLAARGEYEAAFAEVARLARGERIRVVGETGLDYFRTGPEGRDHQITAFRDHVALAKELGLTLQIHDRDAHQDVLDVLARDGAPERTVFHCFSGDTAMADVCVERGYYVSFAGTVTFSNAHELRAAAAVVPLGQILVETDAPFLTPHPHRGGANSPAQVARTARVVADCVGVDLETFCAAVSATSEDLYGPW